MRRSTIGSAVFTIATAAALVFSSPLSARQTGTIAQSVRVAGASCEVPPTLHCPDENCPGGLVTNGGSTVEAKTGRTYFLDYPCDLKRSEKVTFILSLHGGGSYGNWQRHYFPILDYSDKHRLVVATPFSPRRVWKAEDDEYLQNIVTSWSSRSAATTSRRSGWPGTRRAAPPRRVWSAPISSRTRSMAS